MKKTKFSLGVLALVGLMIGSTSVMAAYTIDGDLGDWCVTTSDINSGLNDSSIPGQVGDADAWIPCSSVDYLVEDNIDPGKFSYGNPQYATGVHIRGPPKAKYDEALLYFANAGIWVAQPYGGEVWDIEAIYLDTNDPSDVYLAVVTSTPPGRLGDLGIDLNGDGIHEYGVKLNGVSEGVHTLELYGNLVGGDWIPSTHFPNIPMKFDGGTKIGDIEGAFVDIGIVDYGVTTYVIEIKIPKDDLNGAPLMRNLHLTPICGNDPIPAPELIGAILVITLISPAFIYLVIKKRGG